MDSGAGKVEPVPLDKDVCFVDRHRDPCWHPGHTPGHHSVLVKLRQTGTVLISGEQRTSTELRCLPASLPSTPGARRRWHHSTGSRRSHEPEGPVILQHMPGMSPSCRRSRRRRSSPRRVAREWAAVMKVIPRAGPRAAASTAARKDRMDAASHEAWPVDRLARVSHVSEAHFARSFKQAFGVPPIATC